LDKFCLYLYQHWYSPKNRYSAKLSVVIAYSVECDRTSRKVMDGAVSEADR